MNAASIFELLTPTLEQAPLLVLLIAGIRHHLERATAAIEATGAAVRELSATVAAHDDRLDRLEGGGS